MLSKSSKTIKRIVALIGSLLALSLLVTGCSKSAKNSASKPSETASQTASEGTASALDKVKVTGETTTKPALSADWPFKVDQTEVKVLKEGTGAVVGQNATVSVKYYGVNGRDGKNFDGNYGEKNPTIFPLTGVIPGFQKGLAGQKVGSIVLIGVASADGYSEGNPNVGIEAGDTLLFLCQIVDASLSGPSGDSVAQPAGQPVVTDNKGVPEIKVASGAAKPTELLVQPLIKGKGKKVTATSTIIANYRMVDYATGKTLASTYESGPQTGQVSSLVAAWQKGLVGQTVGSRVLIVSPASLAYPNGNAKPKVDPGTDVVFVVDLLYVQEPAAS